MEGKKKLKDKSCNAGECCGLDGEVQCDNFPVLVEIVADRGIHCRGNSDRRIWRNCSIMSLGMALPDLLLKLNTHTLT